MGQTQEEKEKEAAEGPAGVGGGILSMISSVGGMIPSLLKSSQRGQLEKMQRGQGAGAAIARQTASEAGRRVAGNMGGRGGQGMVREGLRAADAITQRGAQQAAITGARESLAATQMLRGEEIRRRNAFKTLGAGLGQGLAGIGGMLAAAKDQGDAKEQELQTAEVVAERGGPAMATMQDGVAPQGASAQLQATRTLPGAPPGPAGSLPGAPPIQPDLQADQRLSQEAYPGAENKGVQAQDMSQAFGPQAQIEKNVGRLAMATAEKQQAAELYAATSATASGTPPPEGTSPPGMMHAPEEVADYLYNLAMNYDPRIGQGMRPDLVAELLLERGFEVDWARLGTVDVAEPEPYMSPHARLGEKATSGASAAGETVRGMFSGGSKGR